MAGVQHDEQFFFFILQIFVTPEQPRKLLDDHLRAMADDFLHSEGYTREVDPLPPKVVALTLQMLQDGLGTHGRRLEEFGLPAPDPAFVGNLLPATIREELQYGLQNPNARADIAQQETRLNVEQRRFYDAVVEAVTFAEPAMFSLNACGGSGKT